MTALIFSTLRLCDPCSLPLILSKSKDGGHANMISVSKSQIHFGRKTLERNLRTNSNYLISWRIANILKKISTTTKFCIYQESEAAQELADWIQVVVGSSMGLTKAAAQMLSMPFEKLSLVPKACVWIECISRSLKSKS